MQISPGVETLTITEAEPGTHLRLEDADGTPSSPWSPTPGQRPPGLSCPPRTGCWPTSTTWWPSWGRATRSRPATTPWSTSQPPAGRHGPVRVLAVDDLPDPSLYDQELAEGFGYLTVRDGVPLSVMVRFPDENLYGPAPWPTVIEYSGYGPSNPDAPQPGTLLANLLGFAAVGVNIRGTGCSGGVFDVFSPAQAADGYDVVETVARQPWVLHGRPGMVGLATRASPSSTWPPPAPRTWRPSPRCR